MAILVNITASTPNYYNDNFKVLKKITELLAQEAGTVIYPKTIMKMKMSRGS